MQLPWPPDEGQRCIVLAAALLHDIGHGPFSHAFEKVTKVKHENFTRQIIADESTQVHQRLRSVDASLPDRLKRFFSKEKEEGESTHTGLPAYLTHVISSQLDADRCDYLLRDSYATGTNYGQYDLDWLLSHLQPQADGRRFFLSRKALSAAEAYVFARFHMYRTVYFHKTTRAAEVMLRLIFQRFRELLTSDPTFDEARKLLPDAPRSVLTAFSSGQLSLHLYSRIDEHAITEFLKACAESADPILKELGSGIVNRELFKAIDVTGVPLAKFGDFRKAVDERLKELQLPDHYFFAADSPADTPYKPYDPDAEKPAEQIFVEDAAGKSKEISLLSPTVRQLRERYELVRYYFPARLRDTVREIEKSTLWKE